MLIIDWSSDVCSSDLVERQQPLALQRFRHLAIDDALRETFGDRGLADAGFADQRRIVLGSAAQYLDHAADFLVATDPSVEPAGLCARGHVARVLLQRLAVFLRVLRLELRTATHGLDPLVAHLLASPRYAQRTRQSVVEGRSVSDGLDL